MRLTPLLALLAGCSAIYDADYDDRKAALEQSRATALPATDKAQFVTTSATRLYWADEEQAVDGALRFHSKDTVHGAQVDYQFPIDADSVQSDLAVSDTLVAFCQEGEVFAAGSTSATPIASLQGEDINLATACAIDGSDVWVVAGQTVAKWHPDAAAGSNQQITTEIDLNALAISTSSINGLAVADATHIVYGEGNNLWLLTPGGASGSAKAINPDGILITSGTVAVDSTGVVYPVADASPEYATFADLAHPQLVSDLIANGGYDLLGYGSIQQLAANPTYTIVDDHLVYQAQGGIFALGLTSGNVIDVLLDGRGDSEGDLGAPQYQAPAVTAKDLMFVQDSLDDFDDPDSGAVFSVDLTGRLQ